MLPMNFFQRYEAVIGWIVGLCPAPDKFAHTYAGLLIWVLSAVILRRPLYSARTLAPVVALEMANELVDRIAHGSWDLPDTMGDMAATWFWPVALFACLRLFPRLTGRRTAPLMPLPQNEIESPLTAVTAVRTPDSHNVGSVLAGSKPV